MSLRERARPGAVTRAHLAMLALCRRDALLDPESSWLASLDDDSVRPRLLELVGKHHVAGLALSVVHQLVSTTDLQTPALSELLDDFANSRRRTAVLELKRDQVVGTLRSGGVEPVVLKGAAMWGTTYPDPWERELADLDILTEDADLPRALCTLERSGYRYPFTPEIFEAYRRSHFHIPVHHREGHIVEVHWALTKPASPFRLSAGAVRERSIVTERQGQPGMRIPCPEHLLLHTVLQNVQEGFARLARLVDVDRLATSPKGLDWDLVVAESRDGGLAAPAALTLRLAMQLLETPVPRGVVDALLPRPLARWHLALLHPCESLLLQRLPDTFAAAELLDMWLMGSVGPRLTRLRDLLRVEELTALFNEDQPGLLDRALRLPRIGLQQVLLYLAAALDLTNSRGRDRLRFWSTDAAFPSSR